MTIHRFGDHIDTDIIIPAKYLTNSNYDDLKSYCMEPIDPGFSSRVSKGDIIIAGENFGCGSSREHAPAVIKALGVQCVIAKSFARIFYRNAFNIGLALIESDQFDAVEKDHELLINFKMGVVHNLSIDKVYPIDRLPDFMMSLIDVGGILAKIGGDYD